MEAAQRSYRNPPLKRSRASESPDSNCKRFKKATREGSGYNRSASSASWRYESDQRRNFTSRVVDYWDPFSISNVVKELDFGKYGSVTKEIEELVLRRRQILDSIYAREQKLPYACIDLENVVELNTVEAASVDVIELTDDQHAYAIVPFVSQSQPNTSVIVIDSDVDDGDDTSNQNQVSSLSQVVNLEKPSGNFLMKDFMEQNFSQKKISSGLTGKVSGEDKSSDDVKEGKNEPEKDEDEDLDDGSDDMQSDESGELSDNNSDGHGDIWNLMYIADECSKDRKEDVVLDRDNDVEEEDCDHCFIMKDDIGDVCRVCGVIKRGIETIIEYNFSKSTRNTRTYKSERWSSRESDRAETSTDVIRSSSSSGFLAAEINPHPLHRKEMKPHQIEGFNFLVSNLVCDNPGGCIMAHAPGSGKTFMIISFLHSFMAKYPAARPLVVLPRGILPVWKREFSQWQVEDVLNLYDFYSVKAESRAQQLKVLKDWAEERSILFLSYKQFSSIVCDSVNSQTAVACQNYLLKVPSILILDEGHTPRNPETNVLTSLERVETARKVVLSGTLYQNQCEEVFNILNLVRPRFLKMETSKSIRRRILSRAEISGQRNNLNSGSNAKFYELIEKALIKDENYKRKMTVIQDLREMARNVLHYYKGDNLDDLPGLVDFSLFLRMSNSQKFEIKKLKKSNARKFKMAAQASAIYVHPKLKSLAVDPDAKTRVGEEKIDEVMANMNLREGVKLDFYLNLLKLCESSGEKLLVFSQFLLPLKFLERATAKVMGYAMGREMFVITGDSDTDLREDFMEKFNFSSEARVLFGSIRACGEGISLVGASRIIILDIHLNPSVTRQAIGRAFRPGQLKKVYTYRLIADESPEIEDHTTCFKKESIAKMWFEWDGCVSHHKTLEMEKVDVSSCGDMFLESPKLNEDVVSLFLR